MELFTLTLGGTRLHIFSDGCLPLRTFLRPLLCQEVYGWLLAPISSLCWAGSPISVQLSYDSKGGRKTHKVKSFCHVPAAWLWTHHRTSLGIHFLIYTVKELAWMIFKFPSKPEILQWILLRAEKTNSKFIRTVSKERI